MYTTGASLVNLNGDAVLDRAGLTYLSAYLVRGGPPPVQGLECFVVSPDALCPDSLGCQ